ncbi:MAG: resolvase [Proteobacteria bacterium SG_bin9]|nr:MAG: resolvase [Proteobacteria bacterium SG_bin9]
MPAKSPKPIRCAIYTRKSTEHGLELEFNSLDAQREACEAYIKSQASQGWQVVRKHYDDPAYSGGNLDRPALKTLLADIEAGLVDVIVVYKIDRLTRSLADFAKLVEMFDARSISFVAVTQQFNTTSSMGRLTLNVLLSFAQFERELSSERVRDKVAASRRKGKWTGGTIPLGYDVKDKKLVVNAKEAETVKTIFKLYIEHRSFNAVAGELNRRKIVSKRREAKEAKYQGGIPFTYGPLAHLLKNRIYLGETTHSGKWYAGEHAAIVDRRTFDAVQKIIAENRTAHRTKQIASGAPLGGKLFDDHGNLMRPNFSVKKGVRYRFYVSSATLRGRKGVAGIVTRVSANDVETLIAAALRTQLKQAANATAEDILAQVERAVVKADCITIAARRHDGVAVAFDLPWQTPSRKASPQVELVTPVVDQKLLQAVVRAHAWIRQLGDGTFANIEDLAKAADYHPKVVRQNLRLAFLPPEVTAKIVAGDPLPFTLATIPKQLPLDWAEQRRALRLP